MHHIYKTRAIILNSQPIKEADKQLVLLTQDFGLIKAIAQGTRKNESKLRQSIQNFSISNIALVKGKVGWRLTNAQIDYQISAKITDQKLFKSIIRVFNLIERLVLGESDDEIFQITMEFIEFAQSFNDKKTIQSSINNSEHSMQLTDTDVDFKTPEKITKLTIDKIKTFETIFVIKILNKLGYIDSAKNHQILTQKISLEIIDSIDENQRKELNKNINQSIRQSGL